MFNNNLSDNKIDQVNNTFRMADRIFMLVIIIVISKIILGTALDVETIHRDYKNSSIVEATSTEIFNINDYKDSVKYKFSYNGKKYETEKIEPKGFTKTNTKSKIRISNTDPEMNFPLIDESSCITQRVLPDIITVIVLIAVTMLTKLEDDEEEKD